MEMQMEHTNTKWTTGLWVGLLTTLAVTAILFLGNQLWGLPFLPFDIFDWMARVLPGDLIVTVIQIMVGLISGLNLGETSSTAKLIELSMALVQFIVPGVLLGILLARLSESRRAMLPFYGMLGGFVLLVAGLLIKNTLGFEPSTPTVSTIWLAVVLLAWGYFLGWAVQQGGPALAEEPGAMSRREFLAISGVGSLGVAVLALGLGRLFMREEEAIATITEPASLIPMEDDPFGAALTSGPAASPSPEELAARAAAPAGTRPELTSNEDFYRIDINTIPPSVNVDSWRLNVTGNVDNPLALTLADLMTMPSQTQILTMQCISNPIGGDLTGTTRWTGVKLRDVLDRAGLQDSVHALRVEADDGFFEYVSQADMMDERTLLVYAMNGEPLPREHGAPLRIYIANRYGMKQPKWITEIRAVDDLNQGYWVVRGWSEEARPQTVSVVDTVRVNNLDGENAPVEVGGIAWAGDRGISMVEVQVNDGSWEAAELIAPPLSPLTWVQWRYEWPFESGTHMFRVRAYDGSGEMQISDQTSARPNGATGIHGVQVRI